MKKTVIIILVFYSFWVNAQPRVSNNFDYKFELGSYFSITNNLPFWLRANQFGTIPTALPALSCKQSIRNKKDTSNKYFKLNYGAELVTILGNSPKIILPEAYLSAKIGKFEIMAGRRKDIYGLVDTLMSSGSISWSGNALPLPIVQISIPEYTKFFVNWLSFKGSYTHGWFGNQRYAINHFLHQKTLFFRLGKPDTKLNLYGGIVHNVMWGGKPTIKLPEGDERLLNGRFPSDWFVYGNVVFPFKNFWNKFPAYKKYNFFETGNHFGNQLGSVDIAGELKLKKGKLLVYKQFVYDDGQLFGLTNTDDGLYGISFTPTSKSSFKKVIVEYLYTKNQGKYVAAIGRLLGLEDRHPNEESFLFNHQQYLDGWSYNRQTIGTPFLTPEETIRTEKQINNGFVFINNNRIWAIYGGLVNQIGKITLTNRYSVSKNFGNNTVLGKELDPVKQVSYSINTNIPMSKIKTDLNITIGIDHGDLIHDNFGSYISLVKKW